MNELIKEDSDLTSWQASTNRNRDKLLRAFSLLSQDTQPELQVRISNKITAQRVFNLPG